MPTIKIVNRYDRSKVLYTYEASADDPNPVRSAVVAAVAADANLADAYLAGAYLDGANLADAYLAGANLARANLAGANLARAYLAGADLARAYLADAYLAGANLARAYLARAYLAGAYLDGANLARASDTYVRAATPEERAAKRMAWTRAKHPDVPVIDHLDARILRAISAEGAGLEMGSWHTCETTHCLACWAITLAGEAGRALERRVGAQRAGTLIYHASTGVAPHFFASNERALADLRERAAKDPLPGEG